MYWYYCRAKHILLLLMVVAYTRYQVLVYRTLNETCGCRRSWRLVGAHRRTWCRGEAARGSYHSRRDAIVARRGLSHAVEGAVGNVLLARRGGWLGGREKRPRVRV